MERQKVKPGFTRRGYLVLCVRFLCLYALFLLIAKYSTVFRTGAIPQDLLSLTVVSLLITYRFFSIALVPALLVLYLANVERSQ